MSEFQLSNLTPAFGVELIASENTLNDNITLAQLLRALLKERKLILIRGAAFSEERHINIVSMVGRVISEKPGDSLPCSYVTNINPNGYITSQKRLPFHSDFQFSDKGPLEVLSLYAVEVDHAEPTVFFDMVSSLKRIPPALLTRLEGLDAVQSLGFSSHSTESERTRLSSCRAGEDAYFPRSIQPAIKRHPKTDEKYLNVSQLMTSHFAGLDDAQSDALFAEIDRTVYQPIAGYRHSWRRHDLLIWDNVALQHGRDALASESSRTLRRVVAHSVDLASIVSGITIDAGLYPALHWWMDLPKHNAMTL